MAHSTKLNLPKCKFRTYVLIPPQSAIVYIQQTFKLHIRIQIKTYIFCVRIGLKARTFSLEYYYVKSLTLVTKHFHSMCTAKFFSVLTETSVCLEVMYWHFWSDTLPILITVRWKWKNRAICTTASIWLINKKQFLNFLIFKSFLPWDIS